MKQSLVAIGVIATDAATSYKNCKKYFCIGLQTSQNCKQFRPFASEII